MFRNDDAEQLLREYLFKGPNRKHESCVEGTIKSIARLNACVKSMACYSFEKEKRGGYRQKAYPNKYGRMVETVVKQLIGNLM